MEEPFVWYDTPIVVEPEKTAKFNPEPLLKSTRMWPHKETTVSESA